jgi:hypothetical protein
MASVVNQINNISDFIQGRAPSPQTQTQAAPHETAPPQLGQAQAPPPSDQPAAATTAPAQQTPHAESAQTAPLPHPNSGCGHIDGGRSGESLGSFTGDGSLTITYREDTSLNPDRIHYYRIDAAAPNQTRLLSNPIFLAPSP